MKRLLLSRAGLFAAAGVAALGIAIGLVVASQVGGDGKKTSSTVVHGATDVAALFDGIPQQGSVLGKPDAPVTLVEYADIQCPFCATWALDAFPAIVREYVRPGKVKLEFRGMAFLGPDSLTALQTAVAAGRQNKLWNVVDLLFHNQGEENSGWVTDDLLRSIGGSVAGLDVERMLDASESPEVASRLVQMQGLANLAGINSTPSFEAGKTGGPLQRLQVQALDASAFRPALDALLGD